MDEQPTLPGETRTSLPPVVQAYVAFLEGQIGRLQTEVTTLQAGMAELQAQLSDAQARAKQHSGNSSRPPSSDTPSAPARAKRLRTGRKRGGQKGHPAHLRLQVAEGNLTAIVEHRPVRCPKCASPLAADLPAEGEPQRLQVWEIPPIRPDVSEHRALAVRCPHCQKLVKASGLPSSVFGPRLTAIGSVLHGRYRLSMRETAGVFADLLGVPIGVGSVPRLCEEVAVALTKPYEMVREQVEQQPHANVDETGWKQAGDKRWLWVAVTALGTLFVIATNRNAAVLTTLLGDAFVGVVTSDRYRAYLTLPLERRQLCWAHLKRNLLAFAERGGPIGDWGKEEVALVTNVFAAWHRFKQGELDRAGLQAETVPLREQMQMLLAQGTKLPSWPVQAFCNDVGKLEPALWTFACLEGVEPTNNAAERALRPAVLWRKGCFGADSASGNTFVAKILTVAATCRQQKRHLLSFLSDAVVAHRTDQPAPALLATV
jgi:transposase